MIAWAIGRVYGEAFGELLVEEGVETILPCAQRVDIAGHLVDDYGRA
jgi:hypothetical protein